MRLASTGSYVAAARQLRAHLRVVNDRAGDQVREDRDEQRVGDEIGLVGPASIAVDQVGELGEGEKRDSDGHDDVPRNVIDTAQCRDVGGQKIKVFEVGQQTQIHRNPEDEEQF